ncbi:outer membrane beta-barrel protein [Rhodoferax sp.]|uniref:outer membrane beta-barrel protein n=1 Tax=Rhodoferax sp. TaxID=50421 RepID=UPI001EC0E64D|nr:outer membrane beta-barrel protein [Rhodoferax sp.]MBT9507065.1 outer membrane beta-barrel protein [Rhodoferax sp.]
MKKSHRLYSRLLLVAAASLATLAGAQAQSSTQGVSSSDASYGQGSSYIGLNAGQSDFKLGNGTGLFASDNRTDAFSIYAGTYINHNFGFEFGYTDFGKIGRGGGNTKADGLSLSLIGKLPLGSSFNLLGKLGTTYGRTEVTSAAGSGITAGNDNGFGWSYGVGAEYAFTPQFSVVLQYDEHYLPFVETGRERVRAAGLGLRFGF